MITNAGGGGGRVSDNAEVEERHYNEESPTWNKK